MNKKVKIAIAIGTTLVVGVGGYLIYRGYNKRKTETARSYLGKLDENGGEPQPSDQQMQQTSLSKKPTVNRRNLGAVKRFTKNDAVALAVAPRQTL
jgi:hypothetical protein